MKWDRLVVPLESALVILMATFALLWIGNASLGLGGGIVRDGVVYHTAIAPHIEPVVYSGIGPTPELSTYEYRPLIYPPARTLKSACIKTSCLVMSKSQPPWFGIEGLDPEWLP